MAELSVIEAIILGVVEGITEFLPISSTGHLIIVASLLGLDEPADRKAAVDAFNIVIQGGAILAVLGLYRARVKQMIVGLLGRDPIGRRLAGNLFIAFLPAAVFGVLLAETIEALLFHPLPVLGALFVGGVIMLLMYRWQRAFFRKEEMNEDDVHSFVDIEHLTWRRALLIGFLQCLAMWPGTSRSMVTIVGGMLVGMRPKHAAEFSFLLGLPTLGGACVYTAGLSLLDDDPSMFATLGPLPIIVGVLTAMISAAVAIRWLVSYLSRHGVALFGWYRIGLCLVMAGLLAAGVIDFDPADEELRPPPTPGARPAEAGRADIGTGSAGVEVGLRWAAPGDQVPNNLR